MPHPIFLQPRRLPIPSLFHLDRMRPSSNRPLLPFALLPFTIRRAQLLLPFRSIIGLPHQKYKLSRKQPSQKRRPSRLDGVSFNDFSLFFRVFDSVSEEQPNATMETKVAGAGTTKRVGRWTLAQLRQTDGIIPSQAGWNKGDSQKVNHLLSPHPHCIPYSS